MYIMPNKIAIAIKERKFNNEMESKGLTLVAQKLRDEIASLKSRKEKQ